MNRHERARQPEISSEASKEAIQVAKAFVLARDSDAVGDGAASVSEPFHRDVRNASATADAIMARVRVESAGTRSLKLEFAQDSAAQDSAAQDSAAQGSAAWHRAPGMRIAMLAAAAVLVAALSSIITLRVLGAGGTVEVRFVLAAPEATSVMLAADFNQWKPDQYALKRSPDGHWEITVPLRKGKSYAYNFVIDGERWIADPSSASRLDDGFGGSSSTISL